jgi:hypothetical protein
MPEPGAPRPDGGTRRTSRRVHRLRRTGTVATVLALVLAVVLTWDRDDAGGPRKPTTRPLSADIGAPRTAGRDAARPTDVPTAPTGPARLRVPALSIDAPLIDLGLGPDGQIAVPPYSAPQEAGWFDGSVSPGDDGTAVIVGHVDTRSGPAVFWNLSAIRSGDRIDVQDQDGRTETFAVDRVEEFSRDHFPAAQIYGSVPGAPAQLRLITCGGPYDHRRGEYTGNTVAFAHLATA